MFFMSLLFEYLVTTDLCWPRGLKVIHFLYGVWFSVYIIFSDLAIT